MLYFKFLSIIIVFFMTNLTFGQYAATDMRHYFKFEASVLRYYTSTVSDHSHDYSFHDNGKQFIAVWGWDFDEKKYLGFGAGYSDFENAKGLSAFGEINFFVSNSYLNPYIGARLGYSRFKPEVLDSQNDITATFLTGLQIRFGVYSYTALYLQTGLLYQQKTLFFPLTLGIKF